MGGWVCVRDGCGGWYGVVVVMHDAWFAGVVEAAVVMGVVVVCVGAVVSMVVVEWLWACRWL